MSIRLSATVVVAALALVGASGSGYASAAPAVAFAADEKDRLLLNNGQIIEGELISEGADTVRFRVMIAGISAETDYKRSDILKIERAEKAPPAPENAASSAPVARAPAFTDNLAPSGSQKVYFMELKGWFGTEIYMPPVRDAVKDARKHEPDYLVVIVNNAWERYGGLQKLKSDDHDFQGLMLAREFDPILTDEIRNEWEKQPRLVFWVKQAMGGAAFIPYLSRDIYFHSEGKMGGIGGADIMFEGRGDEVVRDKMVSLYTATARGLAIKGGHDSRIARAMTEFEYVLSVAFPGPVYHERYPEPGEILLTDNGRLESEADTVEQLARGEGNDVLTLNADWALRLGISRGTANDEATLLDEMHISRTAQTTYGRSNEIFASWRDGVNSYGRKLTTLLRDLDDVRVEEPGGFNERKAARAKQIRIIGDILRLIERYGPCVRYGMENPGVNGNHEQLAMQLRLRRTRLTIEQKLDEK